MEISKIDLSYIDETLREMCPIVNHVWTFFTKNINFLCQYYGRIYVFISYFNFFLPKFDITVIIMW
jgi:hypothetical protein